jgi:hypothetical protein
VRGIAAAVLFFEAIVVMLGIPVAITVSDVSAGVAVPVGVALMALLLVTAGLLRRPFGYALGWVDQVLVVGSGFFVPAMFVIGGVFAVLWVAAMYFGRRAEAVRAGWPSASDDAGSGTAPTSG